VLPFSEMAGVILFRRTHLDLARYLGALCTAC
jgi:hypothetical protein